MTKCTSGCDCKSACLGMSAGNLDDLRTLHFWKSVVAEALGTLFLVFIGCGSVIATQDPDGKNAKDDVVQIALCFGLAVATMVWGISHVSGGHINPAVTIAFMITRRMSVFKAFCYVAAQTGGASLGAWLLSVCCNEPSALGVTQPHSAFNSAQVFGIESLITFVLVFTVFSTCDTGRDDLEGSGPLAIGLSVTLCHLFAAPFTGSSMNPARSFGPALIAGNWNLQWVYWVSPITGGAVAALIYEHFFAVEASLKRFRSVFLTKRMADSGPADDDIDKDEAETFQNKEKNVLIGQQNDFYTQHDRAEGHHVGKLPTPRWYRDRKVSVGGGLTPHASLIALSQIKGVSQAKALDKVGSSNGLLVREKDASRDSVAIIMENKTDKTERPPVSS